MGPLPRPLEGFPFKASLNAPFSALEKRKAFEKPTDSQSLVLEAWAQGYMVGSLVILAFITLANMRRGVLLHKVRAATRLYEEALLIPITTAHSS